MNIIDPITDYTNKLRAENAVVHVDRYTYAAKDEDASIALSLYPFGIDKRSDMIVMTQDEAVKIICALQSYLDTRIAQKRGPNGVTP